jgi:major membrane immunogen (membrane-anchored lipoprotein)
MRHYPKLRISSLRGGLHIKGKLPLFFAGAAVLVLLLVFVIGRGGDQAPVPTPPSGDNGEQEDVDFTEFAGTVFFNEEKLDLDNTPLVAKGLLHLPLLELAEKMDVDVNRSNNTIFIGEEVDIDRGDTQNLKIFIGETDITPSNIIVRGDEFFIEARELAPMLGLNFYENMFANAAYLADETLTLKDGSYVVVRRRDARGWAPEIRITVGGGNITDVQYVELDEEGNNKFEDQDYLANWQQANPNIDPVDLLAQLEADLLENQSVAQVDLTTGATGLWQSFRQLASNALGKANFDAIPAQVADGDYVAVGNPSERGWTPVIEFSVVGGTITKFSYDEVNQDGNSKRTDEAYIENWRNAFPEVDPIAIIEEREQNILATQDPNLIDATTGATSWGINIKQYTTGAMDHASRAELPPNYDTIYVFFGEGTDRGDRAQLLVAVTGEEITLADFSDYRNGIAKKFDEPYLQAWQNQKPNVDPLALLAEMEQRFLETEDPEALDEISGATDWRDSFQELAARALEFIR